MTYFGIKYCYKDKEMHLRKHISNRLFKTEREAQAAAPKIWKVVGGPKDECYAIYIIPFMTD